MSDSVVVTGVGMTPFLKPGGAPYTDLAREAVRGALQDAGIGYECIEQAYVGWVYGDTASGQAALYGVCQSGIPIVNVNNACATGSTALYLARQAVATGAVECALALGFEQMPPGAVDITYHDRPSPFAKFMDVANRKFKDAEQVPIAIRVFAGAGFEYQQKYGAPNELFAKVRVKASRHAQHNERAIFRKVLSVEEVLSSPSLFLNLTRLQACPPTCGAAAAILCSEAFAKRHSLSARVRMRAQAMATDCPSTFQDGMINVVGADMTRRAAMKVYETAGVGPEDIDLLELHDCFTVAEVIYSEALGLCGEGDTEKFVEDGDNTYGGKFVINPSGGLLSKGHPLGATGIAQCAEIVWQLRGEAGARQVQNARLALQHNLGLGGACVVGLYERM